MDGKGAQRGREFESVLVTVWHAVESDKGRGAAVADREMVELQITDACVSVLQKQSSSPAYLDEWLDEWQ